MAVVIAAVLALVVGGAIGFAARRMIQTERARTAEASALKVLADAELEAERRTGQALAEVRQEIAGMRKEAEEDVRLRREEVKRTEDRLAKREEALESQGAHLQSKEQSL